MANRFSGSVPSSAALWLLIVLMLAPRAHCSTHSCPSADVQAAAVSKAACLENAEAGQRPPGPPVMMLKVGRGRDLAGLGPEGKGPDGLPASEGDSPFQDKPDLTVVDTWTVPGSFCRYAVVDFHSTISNIGTASVVDSFYFDMWFDGENIGYARIESLSAGASLELVLASFPWPGDTLSHIVTAMADTDHEIDEELEVNNIHLEYFAADICTTYTEVCLPLDAGWNWFSVNVDDSDMSLDYVLAALDSNGTYIKSQTAFAEYVPAWGGWFGTLTEISCHETYMIKMAVPDTLDFSGFPYDVSTPMELPSGWSWISYLPQDTMNVDDALGSIGSSGEHIKNQTAFAEYVPEWNGWFGTLAEMLPWDGYKIKMAVPDTLAYPDSVEVASGKKSEGSPWEVLTGEPAARSVNPHAYETNSCVIAEVRIDGEPCGSPGGRLSAFSAGECRGTVGPTVTPGGSHIYYLTVYGDDLPGDLLTFEYRDTDQGVVFPIAETIEFDPDGVVGSSRRPLVLSAGFGSALRPGGSGKAFWVNNRPDPFTGNTVVSFRVGRACVVAVGIFNVCGEKIATLYDGYLLPDTYTLIWGGKTDGGRPAPGGVYFCRLVADGACLTDKMVLIK